MSKRLRPVLLAFVLVVGFTEVALRALIISPAATQSDTALGWTYLPHARILKTTEGYFNDHLNSLGLNDEEPSLAKPPFRTLVVGDSYTEAFHVPRSQNFTSIAERKACSDNINAGRSGMTPLHYSVVAHRLKDLNPDQIVMVVSGADVDDIRTTKFAADYDASNQRINHIELAAERLSTYREKLDVFLKHSALLTLLKNRIKLLEEDNQGQQSAQTEGPNDRAPVFKSIGDQEYIRELFEYEIAEMQKIAPVSILYLSDYRYLVKGKSVETRKSRDVADFLASMSTDIGIKFKKVSSFPEYYQSHFYPPVGFDNAQIAGGHLNRAGHRLVAQELIDLIGQHCQARIAAK